LEITNTQQQENPTDPNADLSPQLSEIPASEKARKMEYAEKCQLYNAISGLQPCFYRGLIQIVASAKDKNYVKTYQDHIEVDSDLAPPALLITLQHYIKQCQAVLNKDKKRSTFG